MEFRGPQGVRDQITGFLRAAVPAHAAAALEAWGLTAAQLPTPVDNVDDPRADGYFDREPAALDRWPLIAVTSGRRTQKAIDTDLDLTGVASITYRCLYPVRIYAWVRDGSHDLVVDQRDNLATVIATAVLAQPGLGTTGDLEADLKTIVLAPSDVSPVKGDRFVAGAYVGFDCYAIETLSDRLALPGAPERDTVSGVTAAAGVLPPPGTP
jgi:hypothetical protein